jgi:hypothetical protein
MEKAIRVLVANRPRMSLDDPAKGPRVCDVALRPHPEIKIIGVATVRGFAGLWLDRALLASADARERERPAPALEKQNRLAPAPSELT